MRRLISLFPLQFRVLYRQFLLRIIDLEALSIEADIPRFLGQFAGILIMISLVGAFAAFALIGGSALTAEAHLRIAWSVEQHLISGMMLVVGLFAVVSWDATFPDKRDAMVLSPLPVAAHTILLAKAAASAAIIGIAIVSLNFATGIAWPLIIGGPMGLPRCFLAYWFTVAAASTFLYCSVLTLQGLTALVLSRGLFLRASAGLQLAAFGLFLAVFFLQPTINTTAAMATPENHRFLVWLPTFWFFALFNQLNGSLPGSLDWLASQAWISLGLSIAGAGTSLLLCYLRTMRKTIEQPDLVPAAHRPRLTLRFGSALQTAILFFAARSLIRSRQHRVIFALYLAGIFGLALSVVRGASSTADHRPLSPEFLISTFLMMALAVGGLRSVFSLPISLTANWMLRVTQLQSTEKYVDATKCSLLLLAATPAWLLSAGLSASYRPLSQVAGHLAVLAMLGFILIELSLIGFYKVPFTCSYLPGKVNVQFIFWGSLIVFTTLAISGAEYELSALHNPLQFVFMMLALGSVALGARAFNRHRAKSAVLYFEESQPEVITTLGLNWRQN